MIYIINKLSHLHLCIPEVLSTITPTRDAGVIGVAFEANPDHLFADYFKIPRGVAIIQALNHDVFVLAPPWSNCSNYTASIKHMMKQLAEDPGVIMSSPRLHIGARAATCRCLRQCVIMILNSSSTHALSAAVLANYAEWDTHVYFFGDEKNRSAGLEGGDTQGWVGGGGGAARAALPCRLNHA